MEENQDTPNGMVVNFQVLAESKEFRLAADLAKKILSLSGAYLPVGECMKSFSTPNLLSLVKSLDSDTDSEDYLQADTETMLLGLMMIQSEGSEIGDLSDEDHLLDIYNKTRSFLVCESLHRSNLVEIIHENASYDNSVGDRPLVKLSEHAKKIFRKEND